jgi:hypothetical protein
MSRTYRKSNQNKHYFSGYNSVLQAYDAARSQTLRYKNMVDFGWRGTAIYAYAHRTDEECLAASQATWDKEHRDGRNGLTFSAGSKGFRKTAAKYTRRKNKLLCRKVMQDDWEDISYPVMREGKRFIYNYW